MIEDNRNSLAEHLKMGLLGRTWKDTFLIYALAAIVLLPIGLLITRQYGIEKTLQVTPFIVGAFIIFAYAISYLPVRKLAKRAADSLSLPEYGVQGLAVSKSTFGLLGYVLNILAGKTHAKERDRKILLIWLKYPDMNESRGKLHSLYQLYNECDYIIHSSDAHYPVSIAKVESISGSLQAKLFGEPKVISFMTELIEEAGAYLYRSLKRETNIEKQIAEMLESTEKIPKLERILRESGLETTQIKFVVDKSMVRIYREIYELLGDGVTVQVNEKTYPVGSKGKEDHIKSPNKLILLESSLAEAKENVTMPN